MKMMNLSRSLREKTEPTKVNICQECVKEGKRKANLSVLASNLENLILLDSLKTKLQKKKIVF